MKSYLKAPKDLILSEVAGRFSTVNTVKDLNAAKKCHVFLTGTYMVHVPLPNVENKSLVCKIKITTKVHQNRYLLHIYIRENPENLRAFSYFQQARSP
jgi:hypothetical protein